uniref:Reverse transcriptase domain-containing protein n=1 Tax=Haemonchus contortus TaxID=6289 RepID=A0A7I4YV28_HAECO
MCNQGVPTQHIRMLHELHDDFTTSISPSYKEVIINVKRGVRQGDSISPEFFRAALENIMHHLEWENQDVKVDDRAQHHLRFADDIVLITPNIEQAKRMLAEFDCLWKDRLDTELNEDDVHEERTGREVDIMNDLALELCRRKRAEWRAFKNIEGVVEEKKNIRLRVHLFDTAVLPALTYTSGLGLYESRMSMLSALLNVLWKG